VLTGVTGASGVTAGEEVALGFFIGVGKNESESSLSSLGAVFTFERLAFLLTFAFETLAGARGESDVVRAAVLTGTKSMVRPVRNANEAKVRKNESAHNLRSIMV
jgi:hypothetical protein